MIQWANVVARGELDQGGEYLPWDERKWELNRQALARTLSGISSDVWLSPVACDTLFWLREEIAASGNDFGTIPPKSLPLLDRLVASEPTWENYTTRANCRNSAGQYYLAIQDALEANRLAGVLIDPFSSQWNWYTGLQSGLNREHYELALRWEEAWRAAGNLNRRLEFPLVLYRLGRYAESLDVLREEEEKDFPVQIGRTLLTTTTAPLHRLVASAFPKNQAPTLRVNTFTALRAMCHDKLGQPDLALLFLGVANQQRREDEKRGEGQRIIPLYREAVELITGKMPSK
jgi:tetratricopeptide (TPR) repeat protein